MLTKLRFWFPKTLAVAVLSLYKLYEQAELWYNTSEAISDSHEIVLFHRVDVCWAGSSRQQLHDMSASTLQSESRHYPNRQQHSLKSFTLRQLRVHVNSTSLLVKFVHSSPKNHSAQPNVRHQSFLPLALVDICDAFETLVVRNPASPLAFCTRLVCLLCMCLPYIICLPAWSGPHQIMSRPCESSCNRMECRKLLYRFLSFCLISTLREDPNIARRVAILPLLDRHLPHGTKCPRLCPVCPCSHPHLFVPLTFCSLFYLKRSVITMPLRKERHGQRNPLNEQTSRKGQAERASLRKKQHKQANSQLKTGSSVYPLLVIRVLPLLCRRRPTGAQRP